MQETNTYKRLVLKKQDNFPVMVIIHHSGATDAQPLLDTSNQTPQIIENWHLQQGWEGVGYHYIITKKGEVWKGRPEHYHGAHCTNKNTTSIGICLIGNFDATKPTDEQMKAVKELVVDIMTRRPEVKNIYGHRDFAVKTCPGKNFTNEMIKSLKNTPKVCACCNQIIK